MVRVFAGSTFVEVELVEAAFRAHGLPFVVRYKLRYMEPTFAGDDLRTSHFLVPRSKLAEAEALMLSLGLGQPENEVPSAREEFESLLDAFGTPQGRPLEMLWAVASETFGDWMVGSLPDLLDRLSVKEVLALLEPIDAPDRSEYRYALLRALAEAPTTTRDAIRNALGSEQTPPHHSLRAALLEASAAS